MNERPRASTDRDVSRETSGRRDKPSRAREESSARHGRGEATREAEVDPRTLAGAIELAAQVIDQVVAGHNALEHYHALRAAHPVTEPGAWGRVRDLAWSALRDYGWGRWVLARLAPRGVPEPVLAKLDAACAAAAKSQLVQQVAQRGDQVVFYQGRKQWEQRIRDEYRKQGEAARRNGVAVQ